MKQIEQTKINQIKLIVCDLDGTLLNHHKQISFNTVNYLIKLQQKHYTLVLATGRFYYELEPYIKQLKMREYGGYVICCNGLSVYELASNKIHEFSYLETNDLNQLIALRQKSKVNLRANYQNQYQHLVNSWIYPFTPLIKLVFKRYYDLVFYHDFKQINWQRLGKLCFLAFPKKLDQIETEINHRFKNQYHLYRTGSMCIELVKNDVSKDNAVKYVCQQLNLSLAQVLAFGDGGNDEKLLKQAQIGITMKNALPQTLAKARYVSLKTNDQEGVLDCLQRLFPLDNQEM